MENLVYILNEKGLKIPAEYICGEGEKPVVIWRMVCKDQKMSI